MEGDTVQNQLDGVWHIKPLTVENLPHNPHYTVILVHVITLLCELLQYHMQRMPAQLEATPKLHPIPAKAPWYHMGIDSCYSESFK